MVGKLMEDTRAMICTETSNTTRKIITMIASIKIDLLTELNHSTTDKSMSQVNKANAVSPVTKKANGATPPRVSTEKNISTQRITGMR
eukprot:15335986-Ditylum_brightwellii.AAC.1